MLYAAHWAECIELQLELCWHLSLRNVSTLWISITAKEPAESTATLRHLAAVFRAAHWARKPRSLKCWCVPRRRIVTNHLRERLALGMFWVERAGEVPPETAEALLHRMPFGALLFAGAITELSSAN